MLKHKLLAASVSLGMLVGAGQVSADVLGGGATLPQNVFNDIITGESYDFLTYIGVGSSGGKRAFFNDDSSEFGYSAGETVHYAGSDSIVSDNEFDRYYGLGAFAGPGPHPVDLWGDLIQVPLAATSVTVPYNHSGVSSVNLTGQQLVDIFSGQITNWNQLGAYPSLPLTVVYRTDGSGTVEIFTRHLEAIDSSAFTTNSNFLTAAGLTPATVPAHFVGASGSGGVVNALNLTPGAITFVSPDYVNPGNAAEVASIENRNDGVFHLPTQVNVQATVNSVPVPTSVGNAKDWAPTFPDPVVGYPIAGFTFLLASQCYSDDSIGTELRTFFENHYLGLHDSYVAGRDLIPLPLVPAPGQTTTWADEVFFNFAINIDDASVCAGIGR